MCLTIEAILCFYGRREKDWLTGQHTGSCTEQTRSSSTSLYEEEICTISNKHIYCTVLCLSDNSHSNLLLSGHFSSHNSLLLNVHFPDSTMQSSHFTHQADPEPVITDHLPTMIQSMNVNQRAWRVHHPLLLILGQALCITEIIT